MSLSVAEVVRVRMTDPAAVLERLRTRRLPGPLGDEENLLIIAADHPARGALGAGRDPMAMADRPELLERIVTALSRPGVTGFLGTADLVEDLALLGALEGKMVFGSMNRGGLAGARFELDDRFTGYDARGVADARLAGGKMLLRIDPEDPGSVATLESCARAVDELAERGLVAMIEPFAAHRVQGRLCNDLSPEAMIRAITVASGLGRTSAYTWLKLPVVDDLQRVMAASTLPVLILGGEVSDDVDEATAGWVEALAQPTVRGLVIGRSLLFPRDGDVAAAVDRAVNLL